MRKIYLLSFSIFVAMSATAQDKKAKHKSIPTPFEIANLQFPPSLFAPGCDTLLWSPATLSQYGASAYVVDDVEPLDSGFISGLNAYNDRQKGNYFDVSGSVNSNYVTKVRFAFGRAKSSDMSKTISFKVYDVGTDIALAGSSPEITLSSFTGVIGNIVDYTFPAPIPLATKKFIISVDFSNLSFAANDSFFVYQNNYVNSLSAPDSAVEQWSNGQWASMSFSNGLPPTFVYIFPFVSDNTTCTLLPVTLSRLSASQISGSNKLAWSTLTEIGNKGFEIQRSSDGQFFTKLNFIESVAPFGNSSKPIAYEYIDNNPLEKSNYYRLKQIDQNGKSTFSNIALLNRALDKEKGIIINYPNPVKNSLSLQLAASKQGNNVITVTNISGMVVLQQAILATGSLQNFNLNVSSLPRGTYIVKLNGESNTAKFIKE